MRVLERCTNFVCSRIADVYGGIECILCQSGCRLKTRDKAAVPMVDAKLASGYAEDDMLLTLISTARMVTAITTHV